jgi:hypothetical protein
MTNIRVDCVIEIIHDKHCPLSGGYTVRTYRCRLFRADQTKGVYANATVQTARRKRNALWTIWMNAAALYGSAGNTRIP